MGTAATFTGWVTIDEKRLPSTKQATMMAIPSIIGYRNLPTVALSKHLTGRIYCRLRLAAYRAFIKEMAVTVLL